MQRMHYPFRRSPYNARMSRRSSVFVAPLAPRTILTGLLGVLCCSLALVAWAGRPVRVYDVTIRGGQSEAALEDAMREALVRATGRRESATDPVFSSLITRSGNYVKAYVPGPRGQTQVVFDGVAIERAIVAAGRSVWDQNRPFTLVMLSPALARAAQDAARTELERVAMQRGLPVTLLPLSPVDAAGNLMGHDALMQLAQRYGGDAVLVGRTDSPGATAGGDATAGTAEEGSVNFNGPWQWTLYTSFSNESWRGSLAAGIDGTVDELAAPQAAALSQTETNVRIDVEGVTSLADYAAVGRLLESIPGIRHAGVTAVDGTTASFELLVRGGATAVEQALSGSAHLLPRQPASTQLAYQYHR